MKKRQSASVSLVLILVLSGCGSQESAMDSKVETVPVSDIRFPDSVFRVTLGLTDSEPRDWSGNLRLQPGQKAELVPEHFRAGVYRHDFGAGWRTIVDPKIPNDRLTGPDSWLAHTTLDWVRYKDRARIRHPSLFVRLWDNPDQAPFQVRAGGQDFSVGPADLPLFHPGSRLGDRVRVERVPPAAQVARERTGQQDYPALMATPSGDLWAAWQEYDERHHDSVCVRRKQGDAWGPVWVLAREADVFRTALAYDSDGGVWAIWSMQVEGNWDLYARRHDGGGWSGLHRLTREAGPDIYHRAVTDQSGNLWLIWQKVIEGRSQIVARSYDGSGWSDTVQLSEGVSAEGNNWTPSVAAGESGSVAVAWDGYAAGNYDVYLRRYSAGEWQPVQVVAGTERFEAAPTVAVDPQDRIWVAWHESGTEWGKDTGRLVQRKGTELRESRWLGLACVDGERLLTTAHPLGDRLDAAREWELPHLQIDSDGHPWLLVRNVTKRGPAGRPRYFPMWEVHVTRYDGSRWSDLVRVRQSSGRNDMSPATALDADGRVWGIWATDTRSAKSALPQYGRVMVSPLGSSPGRKTLALQPWTPAAVGSVERIHPDEAEQVERIRSYRVEAGGKTYFIYRGDTHRHTDISLDGGGDGGLLDAYRYARDAAAMDFLGTSDHNHEVAEPYAWWRTQKFADLFQLEDNFTAFYAYERSVQFPNGHRNVLFTQRGNNILEVLTAERMGLDGAERLFGYLRRTGGTSIPHTIATGAGTDWRDSDPEVETLLEIYQGMRDTYEHPGSPRPKTLEPTPTLQENNSPSRRDGTAWSALEKGLKLGFIASSDHLSTHISYACLIAERLTREGLMEAIRARRAYGATDNIVLDVRFVGSGGEHLMGEIFTSSQPVRIQATILGTGIIKRVDLIKDNRVLYSVEPGQTTFRLDFADGDAADSGESYYYIRVLQEDGEIAWGSPAWVTYEM